MRNLQHYPSVHEADRTLGVSPTTLRAWDRAGKLVPARNPMNGYRLYRREEIEAVLAGVQKPQSAEQGGEAGA